MSEKRFLWFILLFCCGIAIGCTPVDQPKPNGEMKATVKRVVDGDTFETTAGDKVRLIGVDTPETVKPNHPVEPYGKEASDYTKQLLTNQSIRLLYDIELRDRYGRLLAYVYLEDGTFVNEMLIRDGYARIMTIPPNVKHAELFLQAEQDAREKDRGLWAIEPNQQDDKDLPSPDKKIKGNINAKGEKIYHIPGSSHYERTHAEVWFATEVEAKTAGFRLPHR